MLAYVKRDDETLGQYLRRLRQSRGIGLRALAGRLGVDHSTLHGWETDRFRPRPDALVRLAGCLEVPAEVLLAAAGYMPGAEPLSAAQPVEAIASVVARTDWPPAVQEGLLALVRFVADTQAARAALMAERAQWERDAQVRCIRAFERAWDRVYRQRAAAYGGLTPATARVALAEALRDELTTPALVPRFAGTSGGPERD